MKSLEENWNARADKIAARMVPGARLDRLVGDLMREVLAFMADLAKAMDEKLGQRE